MKKIVVWGFIFFTISPVFSQKFQDVVKAETEEEVDELCQTIGLGFMSTPKEVEDIINEIVQTAGVSKAGFELKECSNIENAVAKIIPIQGEDVRYIIYDSDWLQSLINSTSNDWSGKFVLAHEIGHHLNGHSLNNGSSNHDYELQADYFAGRALANLGASLEETLLVTSKLPEKATSSHPARADRTQKAEEGWKSVKNKALTIKVRKEDESEVALKLVQMIDNKLKSRSLIKDDYQKTLKQLSVARNRYYKGYTEDIRYFEAICYTGIENQEKAMDAYVNYLSIEGLDKDQRIKEISELYTNSPIDNTAFFANTSVVYHLSKSYYKNKNYDKAIIFGNQFLTRSQDADKNSDIIEVIATSEFEKIEEGINGMSVKESVEKAALYIQNEEYSKAFKLLTKAAESKNAEAQHLLGNLYLYGRGVEKDASKALNWYISSAQQGDVEAQYMAATCYFEGYGVSKSLKNARFWFNKAAEGNHPYAAEGLAKVEAEENPKKSIPVKKTESKETKVETIAKQVIKGDSYFNKRMYPDAYNMYITPANKGNAHAQERIGWLYYKGKGVKKDKDLAVSWWKKAAKQGNVEAINYLTRLGQW
ncbi:M48 family metalloprotease [Marixanthomonas spongiae]|uniref:Peptidase M48 domain-containing protein n=1 Tax=Marixanthomonas spongiae TaxID=2174845 RepID=A0A2U0I0A7_9FLAO|nr:M48 family metalloprotease [Marixanthomonas spongiae]PVW14536.1 hypothetical protein DDV96_08370 [Marixanthomonas spongiae]